MSLHISSDDSWDYVANGDIPSVGDARPRPDSMRPCKSASEEARVARFTLTGGIITSSNERFRELLTGGEDVAAGALFAALVGDDSRARYRSLLRKKNQTRTPVELKGADQISFWALLRMDEIRTPDTREREYRGAFTSMLNGHELDDAQSGLRQLRRRNEALQAELTTSNDDYQRLAVFATETESRLQNELAADLHDHLGQLLVAARLQAAALRKKNCCHDQAIRDLEATLLQAGQATRYLSNQLAPEALLELGLEVALNSLTHKLMRMYNLRVVVKSTDALPVVPMSVLKALYRGVREALINVVRHAGVFDAEIMLERTGDSYQIVIRDSGMGFAPHADINPARSFGLRAMTERLHSAGCDVRIESKPGSGTSVALVFLSAMTADTPHKPDWKRGS